MAVDLAFGLPGTGKSTLLHDLVRAQAHAMRFFVVDHDASWGEDGIHWRGDPPPNLYVLYKDDELPPRIPLTGVFVFRNWDARDVAQACVDYGCTTYVDDEVDKAGRKKGFDDSPLRLIANEGRHLENLSGDYTECHILGACRRPQRIHTDLTELAREVYVFRVKGKNTLQRLMDEDYFDEELADEIKSLPDFEFFHFPSEKFLRLDPVGAPRNSAQRDFSDRKFLASPGEEADLDLDDDPDH